MLPPLLILALAITPASNPRSITMVGDATLSFRPNQAVANFMLTTTHRDVAGVRKLSDEKLGKLVRACRDAGVEQRHIVINEAGLSAEYRGNEVVGQVHNRSVQLTIADMAKLDAALTAAVRAGLTQTGPVYLQNTEHQIYETKVRVLAAASARERARGVIEALGAKLGLPSSVNDHTPMVATVAAGNFNVPAEGPVVTSFANRELTVTSQMTVVFDVEAP